MIYITVIVILLMLSYQYDFLKKTKHKELWYFIMLLVFILIAGFRYRIGVDSIRYERAFRFYPTIDELTTYDFINGPHQPLYMLLSATARLISDEFWVMQMFHSILVNAIIFRFFRLNTKHVFLSILLYFIFYYSAFLFEVMRESCAVCMLLLGWEFLKTKKWLIFTVFICLATLFHISALPLLILPILGFTKIWNHLYVNKYLIAILIVVFIVGSIIQHIFFDYIIQLNLIESVTDKAYSYADTDLADSSLNIFGIIESIIRKIFFPFIGCVILKQQRDLNKNLESMLFICFLFIVLSFNIPLAYRYNNYFYLFAIAIMSDAIYTNKIFLFNKYFLRTKSFKVWFMIIALIAIIQINGTYLIPIGEANYKEYMRYYPYANIISKNIDQNREAVFLIYGAE